jgi:hypothetical protein
VIERGEEAVDHVRKLMGLEASPLYWNALAPEAMETAIGFTRAGGDLGRVGVPSCEGHTRAVGPRHERECDNFFVASCISIVSSGARSFRLLLEFEREPGGGVVHIFARRAGFQKISREEVCVGSGEREMPLQLPLGEHLSLIADVTITTRPGGHDHVDAVAVYRIACAFSPKEIPIERQLELLDGLHFQGRMQVDVIGRTDQSGLAEVSATRK